MMIWCAICVAVAVMVWPWRRERMLCRLHAGAAADGPSGGEYGYGRDDASRVGIAQVIASAIARLKGGGTMIEAFEEQSGIRFATRSITEERIVAIFERRRLTGESHAQVREAVHGINAAAQLSDELGCQAAPCLEAVLGAYRQMRLFQNLQSQAFAVPKATVGLLSALPAVTVILGELMGAKPLMFLFGSQRGWVCLMLGGCCYATGLAWMRVLMKGSGS